MPQRGPNKQWARRSGRRVLDASCAHSIKQQLDGRFVLFIGMMGCGKSLMGRMLASELGLPFLDLDHEAEAAAGLTISEIFGSYGQAEFRRLEERIFSRLIGGGQSVISLGGGTWLSEEVRQQARHKAVTVWLDTPLEVLVRRTAHRSHRPLLAGESAASSLADLLNERLPIYRLADLPVALGDQSPRAALNKVTLELNSWLGS
ncbi:shikimate kinase [Devosia sp. RR2S18]|uniref:shikimate kinase n=1 Tax=Devosia rhizosphaerae TaxID=3049774 RepID=UPI0032EE6556